LKQLNAVFAKANLKEINPIGEKFDPHRHQAISMLPSDKEPNTIINVLQKGYSLHDRVIRPALVTVAKPKGDQA
jgi:molecular chaperone GrpE